MNTNGINSEIKVLEEAGVNVLVTSYNGNVIHSTNQNNSLEYCDSCDYFTIVDDPDPFDSFCDDDVKILCAKNKKRFSCRIYIR